MTAAVYPVVRTSASQPQYAVAGVTVLSGTTVVYPMDYQLGTTDSGTELWQSASDLDGMGQIPGGASRSYSLVYPSIAGAKTITVPQSGGVGAQAFRLTDVAVVPDGQDGAG